jgi:DNA-binding XRE family transcriptional regulator
MIDVHPNWLRPAPPPRSCAELLIEYRTRTGLTQDLAAKSVGTAKSSLGAIEQGVRLPSWALLTKLIDFYDLDAGEQYELFDAVLAAVRQEVAA